MEKMKLLEELTRKYDFNMSQIGQIELGLEKGLDVSIYAKPEFDHMQMRD